MKRTLITALLLVLPALAWLVGCSDTTGPEGPGTGTLRLSLIDAPGDYDAVNIVVTGVSVHRADDDSTSGWFTVAADTDTVDLLRYADGAVFVLADTSLTAGRYTQIRLAIGEGSNVVVAGQVHPLEIPSGATTGVKIVHPFAVESDGFYAATLDFDADRSVVRTGSGRYKLKPVIRAASDAGTGAITGIVVPADAFVMTLVGADTVQTYADRDTGRFRLALLPPGTYDVTIQPLLDAYLDSVVSGVVVVAGQATDLGTIELPMP